MATKRPVTFETFNQSDEETRPVQQKDKELSHRLLTFETFDQTDEETFPKQTKTITIREHPQRLNYPRDL